MQSMFENKKNALYVEKEVMLPTQHQRQNLFSNIFFTHPLSVFALSQFKFREYLDSLPLQHRRNIGIISNIHYVRQIATHMSAGNLIGVGDTTVDMKYAAHSYVLESKDESVQLKGSAPVDCDVDDISSNRAETCSLIAIDLC